MYRIENIQGLARTYLNFDGFHQILYNFFFASAFFFKHPFL